MNTKKSLIYYRKLLLTQLTRTKSSHHLHWRPPLRCCSCRSRMFPLGTSAWTDGQASPPPSPTVTTSVTAPAGIRKTSCYEAPTGRLLEVCSCAERVACWSPCGGLAYDRCSLHKHANHHLRPRKI